MDFKFKMRYLEILDENNILNLLMLAGIEIPVELNLSTEQKKALVELLRFFNTSYVLLNNPESTEKTYLFSSRVVYNKNLINGVTYRNEFDNFRPGNPEQCKYPGENFYWPFSKNYVREGTVFYLLKGSLEKYTFVNFIDFWTDVDLRLTNVGNEIYVVNRNFTSVTNVGVGFSENKLLVKDEYNIIRQEEYKNATNLQIFSIDSEKIIYLFWYEMNSDENKNGIIAYEALSINNEILLNVTNALIDFRQDTIADIENMKLSIIALAYKFEVRMILIKNFVEKLTIKNDTITQILNCFYNFNCNFIIELFKNNFEYEEFKKFLWPDVIKDDVIKVISKIDLDTIPSLVFEGKGERVASKIRNLLNLPYNYEYNYETGEIIENYIYYFFNFSLQILLQELREEKITFSPYIETIIEKSILNRHYVEQILDLVFDYEFIQRKSTNYKYETLGILNTYTIHKEHFHSRKNILAKKYYYTIDDPINLVVADPQNSILGDGGCFEKENYHLCFTPLFSFSTPLIEISINGKKIKLGVGHSKIHANEHNYKYTSGSVNASNFREKLPIYFEKIFEEKYIGHQALQKCNGYIYLMYFYYFIEEDGELKFYFSDSYLPILISRELKYIFSLIFPVGLGVEGKNVYVTCGEGDFYNVLLSFDLDQVFDLCKYNISNYDGRGYDYKLFVKIQNDGNHIWSIDDFADYCSKNKCYIGSN